MTHTVEGNNTVGFRVVDDKVGPLTGRLRTEQDALDAAGVKAGKTPASKAVKTSDVEPEPVAIVETPAAFGKK